MIRVLHTGSLDVRSGGPAMSAYLTMKGLAQNGVQAELLMYDLDANGQLIGDDVAVHYAGRPFGNRLAYSPTYKRHIAECGDFDIYHAQGVWQWPTYALASYARKVGKPYLITPRGMLYPQDIAKSSTTFKKLSLKFRLLSDLNKAACVQVTCDEEMRHCRALGVKSPIAVIPNPIVIRDYEYKKPDSVFRLGYLGRLSPRKNVEGLIYAFAELGSAAQAAELLIIGGGDDRYESFLKAEVERLGLRNVRFAGFLSGREKDEAIASLSVLAMPSEFENFGNVILEGLLRGIPCIATQGSPWSELKTHQCGWWVEYSQRAITEAVRQALQLQPTELEAMGQRGRKLVEANYSVESVGQKMASLYEWILNKSEKPEFVFFE
ncbi:MAG: glycosyltransferase [Bacteroidales bacterium]|nr:glycosyltransferase [Bacteroidales bacterium]